MGILSPGFRGRRQSTSQQLPPGQYLTEDFPVLSAGPTPRIPLESWELVVITESGEPHRWSWPDLTALPSETPTVDIHCVTKWSKLATTWRGVSLDVLLAEIETAADFALVQSYGGLPTKHTPMSHLSPPGPGELV